MKLYDFEIWVKPNGGVATVESMSEKDAVAVARILMRYDGCETRMRGHAEAMPAPTLEELTDELTETLSTT